MLKKYRMPFACTFAIVYEIFWIIFLFVCHIQLLPYLSFELLWVTIPIACISVIIISIVCIYFLVIIATVFTIFINNAMMNALVLIRQAYEPYKEWTGALTMCFFFCLSSQPGKIRIVSISIEIYFDGRYTMPYNPLQYVCYKIKSYPTNLF